MSVAWTKMHMADREKVGIDAPSWRHGLLSQCALRPPLRRTSGVQASSSSANLWQKHRSVSDSWSMIPIRFPVHRKCFLYRREIYAWRMRIDIFQLYSMIMTCTQSLRSKKAFICLGERVGIQSPVYSHVSEPVITVFRLTRTAL